MKASGFKTIIIRSILLILLSLYFIVVFGQSSDLVSFDVDRKENNVSLQWLLSPSNKLSTIIIEKKTSDTTFKPIAEFWVNLEGNTERNFHFTDKKVKNKGTQYRLKLIAADGRIEYSTILPAGKSGSYNKRSRSAELELDPNTTNNPDAFAAHIPVLLIEKENSFL